MVPSVKFVMPRIAWGIASILTAGMVTVIAALMATATVMDIRHTRSLVWQDEEERGLLLSDTLSDVLADALYFADIDRLNDLTDLLISDPELFRVQIYDHNGRALVDTVQRGQDRYPIGAVDDQIALMALEQKRTIVERHEGRVHVSTAVEVAGQVLGGATIHFSERDAEAEIRSITIRRLWQSLFLIVVGIAFSFLVSSYFVRPIRRLVLATRGVAQGRYDFDPGPRRADEIGELNAAFGEMTDALQSSKETVDERNRQLATANDHLVVEIEERRSAQESLRRAHDQLEMKVKERTEDLTRANSALHTKIEDRKVAEERITASLHEKEVLLKEVNHRVKNNLQLISSLLNLQSRTLDDEAALAALTESQGRVRSMALLHQQLYESPDLARIDFGEYLVNLASSVLSTYEVRGDSITLRVESDQIRLGIDKAIPCGLIINELITNVLKYAFVGRDGGEIRIECRRHDDGLTLIVSDDGVGLPPGLDIYETETLGLQVVTTLTDQIGGSVRVSNHNGSTFSVAFPE